MYWYEKHILNLVHRSYSCLLKYIDLGSSIRYRLLLDLIVLNSNSNLVIVDS